jgi:hypothetical protein
MHHHFNIYWLPFTKKFINHLEYLMIIFSHIFVYPKNMINRNSLVPVNSDNRLSTAIPLDQNSFFIPTLFSVIFPT